MDPQGKILLALSLALLTSAIFRAIVGKRRDSWFKRSLPKSLITVKGTFGDAFALGVPKTFQGLMVTCALLLMVGSEIAAVCYLL